MVRFATIEDLERIVEIENSSFDSPWSEDSLRYEIEENQLAEVFVIEINQEVVGYMSYMKIIDEVHINNIAIDSTKRGYGYGRELVESVLKSFKGNYSVTLEVRNDNYIAINLYRNLGFEQMGIRKDYYGKGQDALIMWIRR